MNKPTIAGLCLAAAAFAAAPTAANAATSTTRRAAPAAGGCDPNYKGTCVPNRSGDALNCDDIDYRVIVVGDDHNKFDGRDQDDIGCENNPIDPNYADEFATYLAQVTGASSTTPSVSTSTTFRSTTSTASSVSMVPTFTG